MKDWLRDALRTVDETERVALQSLDGIQNTNLMSFEPMVLNLFKARLQMIKMIAQEKENVSQKSEILRQ